VASFEEMRSDNKRSGLLKMNEIIGLAVISRSNIVLGKAIT